MFFWIFPKTQVPVKVKKGRERLIKFYCNILHILLCTDERKTWLSIINNFSNKYQRKCYLDSTSKTTAPPLNNFFSKSSDGFRKVSASTLVIFNGGFPIVCNDRSYFNLYLRSSSILFRKCISTGKVKLPYPASDTS